MKMLHSDLCLLVLIAGLCPALGATEAEVRRVILPERLEWAKEAPPPASPLDGARFLAVPEAPLPKGGLFLRFRVRFAADGRERLRFHVSADERFVLLLDGAVIARGPDRGSPAFWLYQTYETVPAHGDHRLEALVWKLNPGQAPNAQLSRRLGFALAAEGAFDARLTTGKAAWRVGRLGGTAMTVGKYPVTPVGAQCVVSGTGLLAEEPRVWEEPLVLREKDWPLYPSQLPAQLQREIRPGACVAADDQAFVTNGVRFQLGALVEWGSNAVYRAASAADSRRAAFDALLREGRPLTIPPRTAVRFLWNLGDYFCAYPRLRTRGGRDAALAWGWAEGLYIGDCFDWHTVVTNKVRKGLGNRNDFVGKYFYGITDLFRPDGRADGDFTAPWWRSGLFCQIEVKTGDEPLTLTGLSLVETRYPFEPEGSFACSDPTLADIQRICLRGLQMCMHEMHFDCPHYEQQMYGGDTRLQMLICQTLSPDDAMNRQAFRLFEVSQRPNGMVSMNYPTVWKQESTSFSQYWAMMLGDYALRRDRPAWVRSRLPAVRRLMEGLARCRDAEGFQANAPGWHFIDWVPEWKRGTAPGHAENCSSVDNLLYLLTLQRVALAEKAAGETDRAEALAREARALAAKIRARFWDAARGLVADTPERTSFSEHAQALAIITNLLLPRDSARVAEGLASAPDLARCTASFSSYLFEAYFKCGRADLFLKRMDVWRDYVKMGLRTPLEGPGDARSDCHAWSANPIFHFHTGLAGVNPAELGFRSVRIAPNPGSLSWIRSKTSTPKGLVALDLRFGADGPTGEVVLPPGLPGAFVWRGREQPLHPGRNPIPAP